MKKIDLVAALKEKGLEIEEGQEKVLKELSDAVQSIMEETNKSYTDALKEASDNLLKMIGSTDKDDKGNIISLAETMKGIAETMEKMEKRFTLGDAAKDSIRSFIKENHESIVEAVKSRDSQKDFTVKVPAIHTTTNTVSNAEGVVFPLNDSTEIDRTNISEIRYPANFILNAIRNRQRNKVPATKIHREQASTEGAFAVTPEGEVKPLLQYKFVNVQDTRVKIAGRIEWTEEFEMDFEELFAAIVRMFENDLVRQWHDNVLETIITDSTSYVGSTLDGTFQYPDNGLAIVAAASQIQALNYNPDVVYMNSQDLTATLFVQNTLGDLKNQYYIDAVNGRINGMRLIHSNIIEQDHALIMDSSIYEEEHSGVIMRSGQYGNQLIENEYTLIAEVFYILKVAPKDLVASLYIDLETVKEALENGSISA